MAATRFVEDHKIVQIAVPVNTTGAAVAGTYVNMAGYEHLTIVIAQGAWAGGTPAVTLLQAQDVSATGEKALGFSKYFSGSLTNDTLVSNTVSGNTYNLSATANSLNVIEVDASSLDVDNGFKAVKLAIASPGSNNDLICCLGILSNARYPGVVTPAPSALV